MNFSKKLLEKSYGIDFVSDIPNFGIKFKYHLLGFIPWSTIIWYGSHYKGEDIIVGTKEYHEDIQYIREYFKNN